MEKIRLSSEEYDAAVEAYRNKHGYDDMSDEEKEAFDEKLDKVLERTDEGEDTESTDQSDDKDSVDNRSDSEKYKDELRSKYGYDDMSDEQKEAFDEKLDEVYGSEDEEPDEPEKVLRKTR